MSISLSRVGDALLAVGDNKAALASYEESLKVRRHLAEIDDNTQRQEDISLILEKVGDLRRTMGDNQGALAAYEEMLIIDRKLAAADATSTRLKSNVAISLVKLGDAKLAFKDATGALAAYQESYEIRWPSPTRPIRDWDGIRRQLSRRSPTPRRARATRRRRSRPTPRRSTFAATSALSSSAGATTRAL